jgi:hypothetical protein
MIDILLEYAKSFLENNGKNIVYEDEESFVEDKKLQALKYDKVYNNNIKNLKSLEEIEINRDSFKSVLEVEKQYLIDEFQGIAIESIEINHDKVADCFNHINKEVNLKNFLIRYENEIKNKLVENVLDQYRKTKELKYIEKYLNLKMVNFIFYSIYS